jgi:hypothetical protein
MTIITPAQTQISDSRVRNRAGPELSDIGYPPNRFGEFDVDFWKAHLSGAPALLELPTDRPRPPVLSYAGARVDLALTTELTAAVRRLSQRHGATLFMTLLSGWSALLSKLSGQSDIVIGTSVNNRQRSEIEPQIGSSANTRALRVRLTSDPSVADLLAQIKSTALAAYAHQDIPFARLVDALEPSVSLSYYPIYQVMLELDNAPGESELSRPALESGEPLQEPIKTKFDLTLALRDAGKSITGYLEYSSDLFERPSIERMAWQLRTVLEAMVADDQQHISELKLLPQPEPQQALTGPNAAAARFPSGSVSELSAEQVGRTSGSDALVNGERRLSYTELVAARTHAELAAAAAREHIAELEAEAASSVAMPGVNQDNIDHLGTEEAAHLLVRIDGDSEIQHLLGHRTTIGCTPDNDLNIDADFISRKHAVALRRGDKTVIEDLNSTNGTYVNGQRVKRRALKNGDRVTLGKTEFRFSVNSPTDCARARG